VWIAAPDAQVIFLRRCHQSVSNVLLPRNCNRMNKQSNKMNNGTSPTVGPGTMLKLSIDVSCPQGALIPGHNPVWKNPNVPAPLVVVDTNK